MKISRIIFIFLIIGTLFNVDINACTDIVVGKDASTDGSVIISHTDCGDDCRIRVIKGQIYPEGAMAPVYWGIQDVNRALDDHGEIIGYIPQVSQTYTYFHSAYPHMNEFQLAIAESTTSMRSELKFKRTENKQIMTIEQAQIFALQRCKKAKDAIKLIGFLMETYGFLPSCVGESETLCIGDPDEAWVIEVFAVGHGWDPESGKPGAIWAAQRVPDDHVLIVPNWSIIKQIDISDTANFLASPNYMQEAIDREWFNPDDGKPFIWQEVYTPTTREWATGRFWLFYSKVSPNLKEWPKRDLKSPFSGQSPYIQYVEPLSMYPFSVKPDYKLSVKDVMDFQRSVFKGTIYDMTSDPDWYIPDGNGNMKISPLATPFPTKPMRELLDINWRRNVSRGGYGMIAQLRNWLPDEVGGIYWVYLDNQYTSIYLPIYAGVTEINPLYKTYDPKVFSGKSARWAYDFVDNLLYLKWQDAIEDLHAARDPVEQEFFEEIEKIDKEFIKIHETDPEQAKKYLTELTWKRMDKAVNVYKELKKVLIVKYTNNKQGS